MGAPRLAGGGQRCGLARGQVHSGFTLHPCLALQEVQSAAAGGGGGGPAAERSLRATRAGNPRAEKGDEPGRARPPRSPPLPCGRRAPGPGAPSGRPGGAGLGQFGNILAALGSRRREPERGAPGWGTVARGTAGVSGSPERSLLGTPPALKDGFGNGFGTGLGTGKREGCGRGDGPGSPAAAPRGGRGRGGNAPRARGGQRPGAPGGAAAGRRGSARDKGVVGASPDPPLHLPTLCAPTRAGERDPCPDPSPRPARAITKETRPPGPRRPRAVWKRIHQRAPGVGRLCQEGRAGKDKGGRPPFSRPVKGAKWGTSKGAPTRNTDPNRQRKEPGFCSRAATRA